MTHSFYEFFAGGGMARAGLGPGWRCLFANDLDAKKAESYARNWGGGEMVVADVASLATSDLPDRADLSWASFPCQDLSLAGVGAGLGGQRSGAFWPFWTLMKGLCAEGRGPRVVVLENVTGAVTSRGGHAFATIAAAITAEGYRVGALVVDAVRFVPQSRPRLFIVAVRRDVAVPEGLVASGAGACWHGEALRKASAGLSAAVRRNWIWWSMPEPPARNIGLQDIIEASPADVAWRSAEETARILDLMNPLHRQKVRAAQASGRQVVGTLYKRTRADADGVRRQRAEVRFDDVAGCLRTPAGGSSRQSILVVDGASVRSRLLSAREAARLMGLEETYVLPERYNDAYHLVGDGVAVPVVRYLAERILEPIIAEGGERAAA